MGTLINSGDSGVITVALAMKDNEDPLANQIVTDLTEQKSLVRFIVCADRSDAVSLVQTGDVDVAWIFHDDLEEKIETFAYHTNHNNAFVTVVQREDSVFLRIAQEKLNSTVYPYISKALFSQRVHSEFPNIPKNEIDAVYAEVKAEGDDLFEFVYLTENSVVSAQNKNEDSFLVSPIRGILAIMIVIGGIAVSSINKFLTIR